MLEQLFAFAVVAFLTLSAVGYFFIVIGKYFEGKMIENIAGGCGCLTVLVLVVAFAIYIF